MARQWSVGDIFESSLTEIVGGEALKNIRQTIFDSVWLPRNHGASCFPQPGCHPHCPEGCAPDGCPEAPCPPELCPESCAPDGCEPSIACEPTQRESNLRSPGAPMTMGNMRELGAQRLICVVAQGCLRHVALIDVSKYPADQRGRIWHEREMAGTAQANSPAGRDA
jgi:hypothetical protein